MTSLCTLEAHQIYKKTNVDVDKLCYENNVLDMGILLFLIAAEDFIILHYFSGFALIRPFRNLVLIPLFTCVVVYSIHKHAR